MFCQANKFKKINECDDKPCCSAQYLHVYHKPPRNRSSSCTFISIIHINPVGHLFMWWSGACGIKPWAGTGIRKVKESRDKLRARVPACPGTWSTTRHVWVSLGSCCISEETLFSQALLLTPYSVYVHPEQRQTVTRLLTGCELRPHVASCLVRAGSATAAEYWWTSALCETWERIRCA